MGPCFRRDDESEGHPDFGLLPHLDVFAQHARPRLAGEHVAVFVDRAEFRSAAGRGLRIAALVEDEVLTQPFCASPILIPCSKPGLSTLSDSESNT